MWYGRVPARCRAGDHPYPPEILPDERELIPRMQGALQGVCNVQHGVVHQHFDMFSEVPCVRVPERLVQLRKPPTQAAQDLADRVAVLEGLVIHFRGYCHRRRQIW